MANMNSKVTEIVYKKWESHALAGYWASVKFQREEHRVSFLLFERAESEKPYFVATHEFIQKVLQEPSGLYTKKRSKQFLDYIQQFLDRKPFAVKDLRSGQRVRLKELREISPKYREGTLSDLQLEDNIVNLIDCAEEHGYQDTYGSAYVNEIVLVKDDEGLWRPFDSEYVEAG